MMGEIEAAKVLRSEGLNVHFQTAIGPRGPNTADFLVGGERGTGLGGRATDVFTPITRNSDNVIKGIFNKDSQTPHIILNLRHTPVKLDELGDILNRVNSFHPEFPGRIQSVRIIE